MRKAFTLAIAFAGLIALGGCAVTPSVSVHSLSAATPQIITTDSSARAIIMVRKADGGTGFCAEPSPDTAMSAVAKLIAEVNLQNPNIDAKTQIEFQTAVIELTRRTAATQLLRDSFYRICEAGLNQNLTGEQVINFHRMLSSLAVRFI